MLIESIIFKLDNDDLNIDLINNKEVKYANIKLVNDILRHKDCISKVQYSYQKGVYEPLAWKEVGLSKLKESLYVNGNTYKYKNILIKESYGYNYIQIAFTLCRTLQSVDKYLFIKIKDSDTLISITDFINIVRLTFEKQIGSEYINYVVANESGLCIKVYFHKSNLDKPEFINILNTIKD